MPVPPGLSPVANDAQETGDSGGLVVPRGSKVPDWASRARFGSLPSLAHFASRLGSAPSKPRTTTCVVTGRVVVRRQPVARPAKTTAATTQTSRRTLIVCYLITKPRPHKAKIGIGPIVGIEKALREARERTVDGQWQRGEGFGNVVSERFEVKRHTSLAHRVLGFLGEDQMVGLMQHDTEEFQAELLGAKFLVAASLQELGVEGRVG